MREMHTVQMEKSNFCFSYFQNDVSEDTAILKTDNAFELINNIDKLSFVGKCMATKCSTTDVRWNLADNLSSSYTGAMIVYENVCL
jgi:hypothetical protein